MLLKRLLKKILKDKYQDKHYYIASMIFYVIETLIWIYLLLEIRKLVCVCVYPQIPMLIKKECIVQIAQYNNTISQNLLNISVLNSSVSIFNSS